VLERRALLVDRSIAGQRVAPGLVWPAGASAAKHLKQTWQRDPSEQV